MCGIYAIGHNVYTCCAALQKDSLHLMTGKINFENQTNIQVEARNHSKNGAKPKSQTSRNLNRRNDAKVCN